MRSPYIDDTTLVETTLRPAIRHKAGHHQTEVLQGNLSSLLFVEISPHAADIGMVVNCRKTQLLYIVPNTGYNSTAKVHVEDSLISKTEEIKLLGFTLEGRRGVSGHVNAIRDNFRRFWSLIHLRRAGIKGHLLFRLYSVLVQPILETNSVVFHSMLTEGQEEMLKKMQKHVIRLCYGPFNDYKVILEEFNLTTLQSRREAAARKFVGRVLALGSPFAAKWFVRRP